LTDAGQASALLAHLRKYALGQQVELEDRSDELVRFDFYGGTPEIPSSASASEGTQPWPPEGEIAGSWLVAKASADEVEAGLSRGLARWTEEAAEIARIEAGRPLFGKDMDGTHLPDEVGMEEAISRTKGCYVGQEIVARLRTYGHVNKRFVGFSFLADSLPPPGAILVKPGEPEKEAAWVTSAARSARFGLIGVGYARREVAEGDILNLRDDASLSARVAGKSRH
jgi:folate-binding protein YgfZ